MTQNIEPQLHWTEHFVRYGFAYMPGLVDGAWCKKALQRVREIVNNDLPAEEWNTQNTPLLHRPFYEGATPPEPILDTLFEQPRLAAAIEELFGGEGHWNREKNFYIFARPYDPNAKATLAPRGHIDFSGSQIPVLYRGFTFQVALGNTEPFGGNLTVHPGTHKTIQKTLMDNPDHEFASGLTDVEMPPPWEFVAQAGDVVFMHHLMGHSGNHAHGEKHLSRIALHGEAFRDEWLRSIDPSDENLSPWQRSLAHNGPWRERPEIIEWQTKKRSDYLESLRREQTPSTASMM